MFRHTDLIAATVARVGFWSCLSALRLGERKRELLTLKGEKRSRFPLLRVQEGVPPGPPAARQWRGSSAGRTRGGVVAS